MKKDAELSRISDGDISEMSFEDVFNLVDRKNRPQTVIADLSAGEIKAIQYMMADKLKKERVAKRESVDSLANAINISPMMIYRIEAHEAAPGLYPIIKISAHYNVNIGNLINDTINEYCNSYKDSGQYEQDDDDNI